MCRNLKITAEAALHRETEIGKMRQKLEGHCFHHLEVSHDPFHPCLSQQSLKESPGDLSVG